MLSCRRVAVAAVARGNEAEELEIDESLLEDDVAADEDVIPTEPHADVSLHHFFQSHPDRVFPSGDKVTLLFGLVNKGEAEFNVSIVTGSLVVPQDYSYHVENFTTYRYFDVVAPHSEHSFVYEFQTREIFNPQEFGLTVLVYYTDAADGKNYVSTVFNSTVTLAQSSEEGSSQVFLYTLLALLVALGFVLYSRSTKSGKARRPKAAAAPVEMGTDENGLTPNDLAYINDLGLASPKAKGASSKKKSGK